VHLLACDELRSHHLSFEFGREPYLRIARQRVDVSDVSTIWWRRPSLNQNLTEGAFDDDQIDFINKNCTSTLRSFLSASFSGEWVSSPEATDRAADKLHQLIVAREQGFRVPDTLVSNDPKAVREFHQRHHGNIIIKAVRPGTKHLRVNCFGNRVHAALIETEDLDWRPNINVPISPFSVDADLEKRIIALLNAFDLRVGVMDLKISGDRGLGGAHAPSLWMALMSHQETQRRWQIISDMGGRAHLPCTRWALDFMSAFGILWRGRAVEGRGRSAPRAVQPVMTART
jgi:hypothetical protein